MTIFGVPSQDSNHDAHALYRSNITRHVSAMRKFSESIVNENALRITDTVWCTPAPLAMQGIPFQFRPGEGYLGWGW